MFDSLRRWTLAVAGFCLPIEYVQVFNLGDLPITPAKLAGALLVAVASLQWLAGPRSLPRSPKHLWVLAFGFSFVVGNMVAILSGLPFLGILKYMVTDISLLLFYFVVLIVVRNARDLEWLLAGFALGATFVASSALLGYGTVLEGGTESETRFGGLGGNPNETAGQIGAAVPLTLAFWMTRRGVWKRLYFAGTLGVLVIAGFFTLSRSFFVSIPAMFLFGAFRLGRLGVLRYGGLGVLLAVAVIVALPQNVRDRISTLEAGRVQDDGSAMSRVAQAQLGFYAFVTHPIQGVGRRNFMNWAANEERLPMGNVVHNMYLSVAAEQGLMGVIPLLGMIWVAWSEYNRSLRLTRRVRGSQDRELQELRIWAMMMQTSFLGVLIMGLFHPSLDFKAFWMFLGLSTVLHEIVERRVRAALTIAGTELPGGSEIGEAPWREGHDLPLVPRTIR